MFKRTLFALLSLFFVLSACAPAGATPEGMPGKPTEIIIKKSTTTPAAMGENSIDAPAWFGVVLTNVGTGESFTINDFKGKVVLVETLAMWCPSCKKQQGQDKTPHAALGMNKVPFRLVWTLTPMKMPLTSSNLSTRGCKALISFHRPPVVIITPMEACCSRQEDL